MKTDKNIDKLNYLLGVALGFTPYGDEPIYRWTWTEDLFWPATPTGRFVESKTESGLYVMRPEYVQRRMTERYKNQWIISRWFPPEGVTALEAHMLGLPEQTIFATWERDFPGSPIPARGYRIHINNTEIPEGDVPNLTDTERAIQIFNQARSRTARQLMRDDAEAAEKEHIALKNQDADFVADCFTAGLKPKPGSRDDAAIEFGAGIGESPVLREKSV